MLFASLMGIGATETMLETRKKPVRWLLISFPSTGEMVKHDYYQNFRECNLMLLVTPKALCTPVPVHTPEKEIVRNGK